MTLSAEEVPKILSRLSHPHRLPNSIFSFHNDT